MSPAPPHRRRTLPSDTSCREGILFWASVAGAPARDEGARAWRAQPHSKAGSHAAKLKVRFASDVEHGKPTVEFGRVLLLLKELGIELQANITSEAKLRLDALRAQGGILSSLIAEIEKAAPALLAGIENSYEHFSQAKPQDRAIELRAARAIWHSTIKLMLEQVRGR